MQKNFGVKLKILIEGTCISNTENVVMKITGCCRILHYKIEIHCLFRVIIVTYKNKPSNIREEVSYTELIACCGFGLQNKLWLFIILKRITVCRIMRLYTFDKKTYLLSYQSVINHIMHDSCIIFEIHFLKNAGSVCADCSITYR